MDHHCHGHCDHCKKKPSCFTIFFGGIGCLTAFLVAIGVFGAVVAKSSFNPDGGTGTLSRSQLQSLKLSGTWRNPDGAAITFSAHGSGSGAGQGEATFVDVPNLFTYEAGTPPTSSTGQWQPGSMPGSSAGLEIRFASSSTRHGAPTSVLLLAEGNPASPTLICDTKRTRPACTFTKVS